jgi:hypothetical protein
MKGKRGDRPGTDEKIVDTAVSDAPSAAAATSTASTTLKTYENIVVTEEVKHVFTSPELAAIADQMGTAAARVYQIENEKTEQAAHYTALLKAANRTHAELVAKFNLRYEMRDVECRVEWDKPESGCKSFVRIDTGESIREVRMTEGEKQRAFVFDPGDGKPQ